MPRKQLAPKAEPKKRPGYTTRSGKKPLMLNLTPEEHDLLKRAAASIDRPMTYVALAGAIGEAELLLAQAAEKESGKKSRKS